MTHDSCSCTTNSNSTFNYDIYSYDYSILASIPPYCRYKKIAGGSKPGMEHVKFLTAAGDVLDGLDRARSLVKDGQEFTEKEAEGLKVFIDILPVRARSVRYNWNENDQTIPEGWKSR